MDEFVRDLEMIAVNIGGEWKKYVLLDNPNNNDLTEAYNEGVNAMAAQACHYVSIILGKYAARYAVKEGVQ